MKCISQELNNQREIAFFLGMDENLIEKVLSELLSKELIKREDFFQANRVRFRWFRKANDISSHIRNKNFLYRCFKW